MSHETHDSMVSMQRLYHSRYRIEAVLARDEASKTYRAADKNGGRRVALKIFQRDLTNDEPAAQRFRDEAAKLRDLRHPNLVLVYDSGIELGAPFIATEYVEGRTFEQELGAGAAPLERALMVLKGVAAGISTLHAAGLVHRAVTAANVLTGDGGVVKLALPGICPAALGAEALAPELSSNAAPSESSDMYAFGVLAYRTLTGVLPIQAGEASEWVARHREDKPVAPSFILPEVPVRLDSPVLQLLQKDPAQRPTADEWLGLMARQPSITPAPGAESAPPMSARVRSSFEVRADAPPPNEPGAKIAAAAAVTAIAAALLLWPISDWLAAKQIAAGLKSPPVVFGFAALHLSALFMWFLLPVLFLLMVLRTRMLAACREWLLMAITCGLLVVLIGSGDIERLKRIEAPLHTGLFKGGMPTMLETYRTMISIGVGLCRKAGYCTNER